MVGLMPPSQTRWHDETTASRIYPSLIFTTLLAISFSGLASSLAPIFFSAQHFGSHKHDIRNAQRERDGFCEFSLDTHLRQASC